MRKFFYKMTVQDQKVGLGGATIFDFKFVPQLGLTTAPGGPQDSRLGSKAFGTRELQSLVRLALGTAVVGTVAWLLGPRTGVRVWW